MEPFHVMGKTLVCSLKHGRTPMGVDGVDYYRLLDGRYVRHAWAMGGEDWTVVTEQEALAAKLKGT